jgi:hypothetical protein
VSTAFLVSTGNLPRANVGGVDDPAVRWSGAFAAYGGHGAAQSSTIVYEIEPGGRLGWHTGATEETSTSLAARASCAWRTVQLTISSPAMFSSLPTPLRHDLANTGPVTLRAVAFFAAAMFTQTFDNAMLAPGVRVLGTPNRDG